ncbi:unnamed protein product [Ceratitis capitata]|uniref:(Mediterranean fruit fly) hypothetical protein n=1 Tax=Ceratitis capitata TaxID=7213 RepID=A0A811U4K8_CERCA|nr:unnamed protein product [Ceratitis capitata]
MKKITRLLRPKSKKSKDAQYNALNGSSIGNGNSGDAAAAEPIPAVHNYSGKKTTNKKVKEKIITQTIKGKSHGGARKKTQSASSKSANASTSSERASIASTADNNNFNYSSLNRQRNSYSNSSCGSIITRDATPATAAIHTSAAARQQLQKRRAYGRKRWWRRLLHCGVCSCTRRKRAYQPHNCYKDYWNESAKTQKRCRCCSCSCKNSGRRRACGGKRWRWWCCCVKHKSSYQYDSEEDDDIDGKFAAYIYEMQQRDLNVQPMASADAAPNIVITHLEQSMLAKSQTETKKYTKLTFANKTSLKLGSAPVVGAGSASSSSPSPAPPPPPAFVYRRRSGNGGLLKLKPRAWTWDDSLRSNSDRFLETLEEDELNTPSVCSYVARRPPLLAPTAESHKRVGGNIQCMWVWWYENHNSNFLLCL